MNLKTIKIKNQEHTLIYGVNGTHREIEEKIFTCFADSTYNEQLLYELSHQYSQLQLKVFVGNVFETHADIFMLACIFGKTNLVKRIYVENLNKVNKEYLFGPMTTTPFLQILFSNNNVPSIVFN
jgi:hypothetical protein